MSLNYAESEQVRKLSLNQDYIDLVDTDFPRLLSMTPNGYNYQLGMTDSELDEHAAKFVVAVSQLYQVAKKNSCAINGIPVHGGRSLGVVIQQLRDIQTIRTYRKDWQDVMEVLTLKSGPDTWRMGQTGAGVDWECEWVAFRNAIDRLPDFRTIEGFKA